MNFFKQITVWSFFLLISQFAHAANLPEGFVETTLVTELNPTAMTIAPDGRIFILEKDGRVLVVENDVLLPEPLIKLEVDYDDERGLGGIVLDPDFETNQYFYLYYTVPGQNHNRVSRFTANGNLVVPGSEVQILDLDELEGSIHNGGAMAFGADGKLYIATGDGARSTNAQDLNNLLGKILRINKDGSIPNDNPFYSQTTGKNRAIWALGLRNPFSFAIDPVTGTFLVNDVGQSGWEEVNKIVKGKNYGWPLLEGKNRKNWDEPENYQEPLYDYDHKVGCSIIGAAFYNPQQYAFPGRYHGKYFFGDYCKGFIKVLDPETGEELETFATGVARPLAFIVAPDGSFYYLERGNAGGNTSASRGALVKVTYSGDMAPFISGQPSSQQASVGANVSFRVQAGGKDPLSYQWYRNGEALEGETSASLSVNEVTMEDDGAEFHVVVSNTFGTATSGVAVLNITENTNPQVIIDHLTPEKYKAGDIIEASGFGVDGEDGNMPASELSWWIDFHHDDHHHPALELVEGKNVITYEIPRIGETSDNVWYRIYLRAIDSQGGETTVYRELYPLKSDFEVKSQPAGLTVYLDGAPVNTPTLTTGVVGVTRELRAPATQEVNGVRYVFDRWSNGSEDLEIAFNVPEENSSWTAIYESVTQNTAPEVVINEISPEFYIAGEAINVSGSATDEEDGELPASALSWWVEFFHGEESSTAMEVLQGENSISFEVPRTGETSTDVWYRVNLRATDSEGAETTVYQDVQPLTAEFEVQTQPEGLTLYLDGAPFTTTTVTTGVVGGTRQLRAPAAQELDGVLYRFDQWSNESEDLELSINVPEENGSWVAIYEEVQPGTGEGLLGSYYVREDREDDFSGEPVVVRVDPRIDFDWGSDAAAEELPADGFQVRWSGFLEPMVSGEHTFYTTADDGVRLWVNDELVIDEWSNTPVAEATASLMLVAGERYPVTIEYFEDLEDAGVKLEWSSEGMQRAVIPASQLYAEEDNVTAIGDDLLKGGAIILYPVPTSNVLNMKFPDSYQGKMPAKITILNSIGSALMEREPVQIENNHWQVNVNGLPGGVYFIRSNDFSYIIKFMKK